MLHFVFDVETELKKISLVFQQDNIAPSDAYNAVERLYKTLGAMREKSGEHHQKFCDAYNEDDDTWNGISIQKDGDMEDSFEKDRELLLSVITEHCKARFNPLFKNPVFKACLELEHRRWPVHDDEALKKHGNEEIRTLIDQFSDLEYMENFDTNEAMNQWKRLKFETRGMPFFRHTNYSQYWVHVATHFDTGNVTGYSEIIKVGLLVLLIILDSSCCERVFSLMNRIHTGTRNRMKFESVRNQLCISSLGPNVREYDPMPVLQRWLENSKKNRALGKLLRLALGQGEEEEEEQ